MSEILLWFVGANLGFVVYSTIKVLGSPEVKPLASDGSQPEFNWRTWWQLNKMKTFISLFATNLFVLVYIYLEWKLSRYTAFGIGYAIDATVKSIGAFRGKTE